MKKLIVPVLLGGIICWLGYKEFSKPKVAYIHIKEVFDGFAMKKELQQQYEKTRGSRALILDSAEMKLKFMAAQLQSMRPGQDKDLEAEFSVMRDDFFEKKKTFEEDNGAMIEQADRQIMEQLNQYIKEFGAENNYEIIFGAGDDGNLMFAKEEKNISKKVIEYINQKYSGKK